MTQISESVPTPADTQKPARDGTSNPASTWQRIGLVVLLAGTAVMYLWTITINGMGNQFYAAAAQAGSKNWEALLFGSLDTGNFITVDKPPVSQWIMGLSGQIFGFSSASMLVPQALMAVAAVALLYGAVTRVSGRSAGLLAGAGLALTPVAALMFRFNNPDAAMVLLMMAAAYCTIRALEKASARWIALAGVALGFAFLAKMLEGLMVMPALAVAYLIAAPSPFRTRLLHLVGAFVALIVSSGWYVLLTLLWPASSRPYIAGSTDNNFMNLVLGYNGFARVLGRNKGNRPTGGATTAEVAAQRGGGGGGFGNQTAGLGRLFSGEFGFEVAWLIPAALLAMVLVIVARGRAPRTDLVRASAIVFGGWLVIDGVVLSYMSGTIHPYYSLSVTPAIAGMFAIGIHEMWSSREAWWSRAGLAAIIGTAGVWSFWILRRNSTWMPDLRWAILALTVLTAIVLLIPWHGSRRHVASVALAAGLVAAVGGGAAYSVATIGQPHTGGGPAVGPAASKAAGGNRGTGQGGGGFGGTAQANKQLDAMLEATHSTWSAAIANSSPAASLELSTNTAVMAIGGFTGSDAAPTLDQFIGYVKNHQVSYFVHSTQGGGGGGGRGGVHTDITNWVIANFAPVTGGSSTVYNLTAYTG